LNESIDEFAVNDMNLVNFTAGEPLSDVLGNGTKIGEGSSNGQLRSEANDGETASGEKVVSFATYAIEHKRRCTVLAYVGLGCSDNVAVVSTAKPLIASDDD